MFQKSIHSWPLKGPPSSLTLYAFFSRKKISASSSSQGWQAHEMNNELSFFFQNNNLAPT